MNSYYAILHKPTGAYLPLSPTRRGATWVEPGGIPRLFRTSRHAALALRHWLAGKQSVHVERNGDWFGVDDHMYTQVEFVRSRRRADMEIVKVRLTRDL
jgi:hypothetical protein